MVYMIKSWHVAPVAQCCSADITPRKEKRMNKFVTLFFAASAVIAGSASAQTPTSPPFAPVTTDIKAPSPKSAYVQDARGVIVRDPFGLCWRTGYWTPADAVPGCDVPLCVEPETLQDGKCVAPPAPVVPAPAPAPVVPVPVVVAPTSEKVSFAADAFFDFDKATLKPEGKAKLDELAATTGRHQPGSHHRCGSHRLRRHRCLQPKTVGTSC